MSCCHDWLRLRRVFIVRYKSFWLKNRRNKAFMNWIELNHHNSKHKRQITNFGTHFKHFGTLDSALGLRPITLEFHHTKIRLALRLVTFVLSFLTGANFLEFGEHLLIKLKKSSHILKNSPTFSHLLFFTYRQDI